MQREEIQTICDTMSEGAYAFYYADGKQEPLLLSNRPAGERFLTASIIKVPILYVWTLLEAQEVVSSDELCDFGDEPVVKGAGFSWLFRTRQLAYNDVLAMMIATSDNFCTNLIINRLGMERINQVFRDAFGFADTHLGRKMMNRPDPARGKDNWTTAGDVIRWFDLFERFSVDQQTFIGEKLAVCESANLFLRNIKGDAFDFYHKSGGLANVISEWGFTKQKKIFLLTNDQPDYQKVYDAFGVLGKNLLP